MLASIAPHIAEELWQKNKPGSGSVHSQPWPAFDDKLAAQDSITLVVQVNGKVRERLEIPAGTSKEETEKSALAAPKIQPYLEGKQIRKVILVPERLVHIVCGCKNNLSNIQSSFPNLNPRRHSKQECLSFMQLHKYLFLTN